jgi:DNA helicase II / ATP-dependent DNA helicase PcrA
MVSWDDLTDAQRRVVKSDVRLLVVRGGAGTGKTTVALWHAGEHIRQWDATSRERVLFLTFSRTAVTQILQRARSAIAGLEDRVEVHTFHSFAHRLLVAFGRYSGRGKLSPRIQSEAEATLLGRSGEMLAYADLVPLVLEVLKSQRISELVAARWPLVLCDEFQDTAPDQWELVKHLHDHARLVLLADPNQLIYTFIDGVDESRLTTTEAMANQIIELEETSHRDPSMIIPAMATSVLRRDFRSESLLRAIKSGRLRVRVGISDDVDVLAQLRADLQARWKVGDRSFGIFGHSNEGVARLGAGLTEAGIDHVLVGIPEAQGEAFAAMATLGAFAFGEADSNDLRLALATFMTACTRKSRKGGPPDLAAAMATGVGLPAAISQRLASLEAALREASAGGLEEIAAVATGAWELIGITQGAGPWSRAAPVFGSQARRIAGLRFSQRADIVKALEAATERLRAGALVLRTEAQPGTVQLMNFHQTKGREADCIVLVHRPGDYLAGKEVEPFPKASKVLYVVLSRARNHALVVLPPDPHPLLAPFARLAADL